MLPLVHTEDTKNRRIQENLESHEAILIFAKRQLPKFIKANPDKKNNDESMEKRLANNYPLHICLGTKNAVESNHVG